MYSLFTVSLNSTCAILYVKMVWHFLFNADKKDMLNAVTVLGNALHETCLKYLFKTVK